ncbi:MAG: PorT family protein [Bacteroidales bacterium]|nr:PorT family protein [Bacteroidales bacterium]MBN2697759.1 PorT family protein [Bacteroidales bacterium]
MKRPLLTSLLCIILASASGQEKRPHNIPGFDYKKLHFGFTVGLNVMDFGFERDTTSAPFLYADVPVIHPGFQVSIVSDLRLNDHFNLRFLPGISFGWRDIAFYEEEGSQWINAYPDKPEKPNSPVRVGPAFLDFPLHVKYRSIRDNNYRPYLVGGLNFRYDMAAKKAFDGDSRDYIRLNAADLYLELGFGVDTYLRYFKFAPEIKVAMGLNNMIADEARPPYPEFRNSISFLRSYIIMLNFHFE